MKNTNYPGRAKKSRHGFFCEAKVFSQGFQVPAGYEARKAFAFLCLPKQKGFIGPIGDDLPSLIPLLFALMIFFYVFTFTWNIFDQRGNAFDNAIAALRIGNTLKGNNYMRGIDFFRERCSEAQNIRGIKFMAGLLSLSTGPGQAFKGIDVETLESSFFSQGNDKFICANTSLEDDKPGLETPNLYLRSFPVALEFANQETGAFYVKPMLLVVVTWR